MKLWISLLWLALVAMVTPAHAVDSSDPLVLVKDVAGATFERIRAEENVWRKDPEALRAVVNDLLVPYVDIRYAAYTVIGPELQKTSREQRDRFVAAFKGHLVATYASLFTKYRGQAVRYPDRSPRIDGELASVRVVVTEQGKPDINLEFRLRKGKSGEWRAYDMVAEGVSMLSGKQAELGGMIRREGIDAVTSRLEAQNGQALDIAGDAQK